MTNIDYWELGLLRQVDRWMFVSDSGETNHDWLVAAEFLFDDGAIVVEAVPDDDTISVHAATGALTHWAGESACITADHPAVGLGVRWAWSLTNHRGYADGFQLELAFERATMRLQYISEASRLVEFDVTERAAGSSSSDEK
jgi:hypothetical protein